MKHAFACLGLLTLLAACGADGEPIQPTANVAIGVGKGGVYGRARVGVSQGPVSVTVGL